MVIFEQLQLESHDWFLDAEAILKTEKLGGTIHNEPAIMEPRVSGESKGPTLDTGRVCQEYDSVDDSNGIKKPPQCEALII